MDNAHSTALRAKHAGIDARISAEQLRPHPDDTMIARLKKQKLKVKEALLGL